MIQRTFLPLPIPTSHLLRTIHTRPPRPRTGRDLLLLYSHGVRPPPPQDQSEHSSSNTTIATEPAATSFQSIPSAQEAREGRESGGLPAETGKGEGTAAGEPAQGFIASQRRKPTVLGGVEIPIKPDPPAPDECCMSGCVHCTYDLYAASLQSYLSSLPQTRAALSRAGVPMGEWPADLVEDTGAPEDAEARAEKEADRLVRELDPSMRAFLEMERKIKKRKREREKLEQGQAGGG